jgi:hypothetical protein
VAGALLALTLVCIHLRPNDQPIRIASTDYWENASRVGLLVLALDGQKGLVFDNSFQKNPYVIGLAWGAHALGWNANRALLVATPFNLLLLAWALVRFGRRWTHRRVPWGLLVAVPLLFWGKDLPLDFLFCPGAPLAQSAGGYLPIGTGTNGPKKPGAPGPRRASGRLRGSYAPVDLSLFLYSHGGADRFFSGPDKTRLGQKSPDLSRRCPLPPVLALAGSDLQTAPQLSETGKTRNPGKTKSRFPFFD